MRRRRGYVRSAGLASALALVLPLTGCGLIGGSDRSAADESSGDTAYRLAQECGDPPQADGTTVADLNDFLASAGLPAWQAADIGASAALSDGRLVWVFGDTVRTDAYTPRIVANSMILTSGYCPAQVLPADDGSVVPDVSGDVVHWPMSVVALDPHSAGGQSAEYVDDDVTDVLVVMTARTRRGGTGNEGAYDYTYLGSSAAVFTIGSDGVPQPAEILEITPDDEALDQVNWGAAATVSGDWFYLYGTRSVEGQFGRELHVGRAPVSDPRDRDAWEFYDGSTWQDDIDASAPVLAADGGVSQTLSVSEIDGSFVAVSKRDGDLGTYATVWTAPQPTGPWTVGDAVAAPSDLDAGLLQYAPLAHPDVPLSDGELLISVSRNTTDLQRLIDDPAVGRPVFAEVSLP